MVIINSGELLPCIKLKMTKISRQITPSSPPETIIQNKYKQKPHTLENTPKKQKTLEIFLASTSIKSS